MRHKFHALRHSGKEAPDGTSASRISMIRRDSGQDGYQTVTRQARMTNYEKNSREEGGQSLVEVLLALAVAVLIITAITSVVVVALNNAQFSRNQNLANSFAQEGMEVVRGIRDRSWTTFWSLPFGPNFCLAQGSQELTQRLGGDCEGEGEIIVGGTKFIRYIHIQNNNIDCRPSGPPPGPSTYSKATVEVSWRDSRCPGTFCHTARLVSCFINIDNPIVDP